MKSKSIIIIVVTLIIGFILGMLTSAQIRYHKLKPVRVYFSEDRFMEGFYQTIQPDDQQKSKIDQVLDKYAKINSQLQGDFRRELDENMEDFRRELDSNLTKEQLSRLKEMDERRQKMVRQNWRGRENDTNNNRNDRRRSQNVRPSPDESQPPPPPRPPPSGSDTTQLLDNK